MVVSVSASLNSNQRVQLNLENVECTLANAQSVKNAVTASTVKYYKNNVDTLFPYSSVFVTPYCTGLPDDAQLTPSPAPVPETPTPAPTPEAPATTETPAPTTPDNYGTYETTEGAYGAYGTYGSSNRRQKRRLLEESEDMEGHLQGMSFLQELVDCVTVITIYDEDSERVQAFMENMDDVGMDTSRIRIQKEVRDEENSSRGVWNAHTRAWKWGKDNKCASMLIFEDDAFFAQDKYSAKSIMNAQEFLLNEKPFDFLLLGYVAAERMYAREGASYDLMKEVDDCIFTMPLFNSLHAYIISGDAMEQNADREWYLPKGRHVWNMDREVSRLAHQGEIDVVAVYPSIAFQASHEIDNRWDVDKKTQELIFQRKANPHSSRSYNFNLLEHVSDAHKCVSWRERRLTTTQFDVDISVILTQIELDNMGVTANDVMVASHDLADDTTSAQASFFVDLSSEIQNEGLPAQNSNTLQTSSNVNPPSTDTDDDEFPEYGIVLLVVGALCIAVVSVFAILLRKKSSSDDDDSNYASSRVPMMDEKSTVTDSTTVAVHDL